jgi:hypothetical protein
MSGAGIAAKGREYRKIQWPIATPLPARFLDDASTHPDPMRWYRMADDSETMPREAMMPASFAQCAAAQSHPSGAAGNARWPGAEQRGLLDLCVPRQYVMGSVQFWNGFPP